MDLLRLLKEAGLTAGAFDADDLFHLEVDEIRVATSALFNMLKPMVGELLAARRPKPFSLLTPLDDEQPAVNPRSLRTPRPSRPSITWDHPSMLRRRQRLALTAHHDRDGCL
ncbi:hypothetical protein PF003_g28902 [Phytophthora fragariae]|nr:hypothetical protein PF003_g28902 [Phytophthora fragariae]